ncbi:hypothetical protein [Methylobacterium terrae]|uniref:hypothetical protein n=1 Tax=Methylobacterium terrae TaxID=2202827 RepID=UPI0013A5968F|nr:hypothetical protein [Methylobacterium terrae]
MIDSAARPFEDIENFRWGGMHGLDEDIGRRLFSSLTAKSYRILVINDVMGNISSKHDRCAVHDGQLYHWLHGEGAAEEEIDEMVWMTALPWHSLAVIFSSEPDIDVGRCIAEGRWSDLGETVEVIFGAYGGEGFIHWTPD